MVPLSKSGVRKHRGFESRPLRHRSTDLNGPWPRWRFRSSLTHLGCARSGARCRLPRNRHAAKVVAATSAVARSTCESRIVSRRGRLVDYGAALEMRFGATRRGFESRPLRHHRAPRGRPGRALAPPLLAYAPWGALASVLGVAFARPPSRRASFRALAGPASMTKLPEVIALELGTFRFPEPELAHRQGVVMGYAIRHRGGIFLFDTGLGFGNDGARRAIPPGRAADRRCPRRCRHPDRGRDRRRQLPPPCRPLRSEPGIPGRAHLRPGDRVGDRAHRPTTPSSSGSISRAPGTSSSLATTNRSRDQDRRDARAHAGPPVARGRHRRTGSCCSPARPSTRSTSGQGSPTSSRVGAVRPTATPTIARSSASAGSSRRSSISATTGGPGDKPGPDVRQPHPRYPSGAVLGGELAVPCTCNPL